jgi:NDP-sugar pyrophosphorylase family protein
MSGWQYVVSIKEEGGWRDMPATEDHEEANRLYDRLSADPAAKVKVRAIPPGRGDL